MKWREEHPVKSESAPKFSLGLVDDESSFFNFADLLEESYRAPEGHSMASADTPVMLQRERIARFSARMILWRGIGEYVPKEIDGFHP